MGLAAKLAASQQAGGAATPGYGSAAAAPPPSLQPGGGQQQPQQPQYGAPAGAPPQYGAPPGQPQGGRPQSGQYAPPAGAPPPVGQRPQSGQYGQQPQYGAPAGQPQQQYGQQQQQPQYGQQQQPQYGQPAPSQYGQPQSQYGQGGYGAPPPQQQQQQIPKPQVGPIPSGGPGPEQILPMLEQCVREQKIGAFYPPGSLQPIAEHVARTGALQRLAAEWQIPMEVGIDLCKLALFDTIIYADDSGSMAFEEGGSRIDDLKLVISRVAAATSAFDADGIQVRFMNSRTEGNGIRSEQEVNNLINQVKFSGLTPLGTALDQKVLQPLLLGPARANRLQKPVLVIAVTDGVPGGEPRDQIVRVVVNATRELARTRYGADALSLQIAAVGNDQKARAFLEELDVNPEIGGMIDVTSNYENEADNMARANPPVDLTPSLWIVKLLLGSIDDSYDAEDE